ncbi:hypothetical protein BDW71DRAFT_174898 [Aspergillus fruticulosus]
MSPRHKLLLPQEKAQGLSIRYMSSMGNKHSRTSPVIVKLLIRGRHGCRETPKSSNLALLDCAHDYCRHCLNKFFEMATKDETKYAAHCCRGYSIAHLSQRSQIPRSGRRETIREESTRLRPEEGILLQADMFNFHPPVSDRKWHCIAPQVPV